MRTSSRVIIAAVLSWLACFAPVIHGGTIIQSAYRIIQDEGSALAIRAVVNFTGAGVTCADNSISGRTDCTIPGGVTSAYGTVQDNGSALTARAILNFIGASCVDNAGATRTDCTITNSVSTVFGQTGAVPDLSGDCTTSGSSAVTCTKTAGVAFGPYGGIGSAAGQYTAPSTMGFSTFNLGARDTFTALSDGTEVLMSADVNQGGSTSLKGRFKALPAAPWTISFCFAGTVYRSDAAESAGLALYDGTKFIVFSSRNTNSLELFNVEGWNTSANGSGTFYASNFNAQQGPIRCQRISDNGTNRKYFTSADGGLTWFSPSNTTIQANTTFLTATQWGYVLDNVSNGNYGNMIHALHASVQTSVCGAVFTGLGGTQVLTSGPNC